MIKLQQLTHALALKRYGNFHRAAQAQHLSQPAFSRSIRSLEEGLGVPLFDRQTTVVTPNLYGEALLNRAESILAEADELEREIELLQGLEAGYLAVAMGAYAAELSGSRAMGELIRRHPQVRCQLTLSSWRGVADRVLARSVDLGVAESSDLTTVEHLRIEPIGQHEMVFYCRCGHSLLGRETVAKTDLDVFPLASIRVPPRGAGLVPGKSDLDAETSDLIPQIEVDDIASARAIILVSDAFGMATPLQIEPWLHSGELCVLPYRAPWLKLDYGFIYLKNRMLSPAAELFMKIVREIETDLTVRNRELIDQFFSSMRGA
ncbi:MAG TPA: LysR family transcriptional regulator [Candidatus Competibacteraceae bacterium]|nr:LysR family transcriptional regulator [Candidatus Competibacteraceae bacterium]HRZ06806.1 LysR family transcriptional regulator [Candidatus Competibacteraceae bacterium]HSA45907.1 LysR family transcriptional regulator [Candidatus Competibacteraceae bacterium]